MSTEATAPTPSNKTYRGNCHCGAFIFELTCPEITTGYECNCSICYKKGATWTFPGEGTEFKLVKGEEKDLREYTFGSKSTKHLFCPICGTSPYSFSPDRPVGMNRAVNTRAIQDLKIWDLAITDYDGAAIPPKYEAPVFDGEDPAPSPEFVGDDPKTYYGSCHCGAVKLALKSKSLDETFKAPVMACNCSIDQRTGTTWTYPHKTQLSVSGAENLEAYTYGRSDWSISFCRTCGVTVIRKAVPKTDEEMAAMDEKRRQFNIEKKDFTPVNLRLLNGFDIAKSGLNVIKFDGWSGLKPGYVNP